MFIRNGILTTLIVILVAVTMGCADREDRPESEDPSLQEATAIFNRAQLAMASAGIDINLSDLGDLADLPSILPDPLELAQLEDPEAIQSAIATLYEVLDAFGQNIPIAQAPSRPLQSEPEISNTDLALIHTHLAYLYVLEAVRIVTIEGWGKDRVRGTNDDLFEITFPENPDLQTLEVYQFKLTDVGQTRFNQIENNPGSLPQDYLREFRASERQAILDALVLLTSARIRVLAFPDVVDIDGNVIEEQTPQVNRTICRQDALFHLEMALSLAIELGPELSEPLDEGIELIAETFTQDFINQISDWGFEILNQPEVLARINRLIGNR